MKNKTITFFDNYNNYDYDQIKELLVEENIEENRNNLTWINYNPTDKQIEEYSYFLQDIDYEDTMSLFKEYLSKNTLVVSSDDTGINGYIIEDIKDLYMLLDDSYYIVIKEDNNKLFLNFCTYNSNFSYTELKQLNKKGMDLINNCRYDRSFNLDDKDIKKLLSSKCSKKANFSKNVGW